MVLFHVTKQLKNKTKTNKNIGHAKRDESIRRTMEKTKKLQSEETDRPRFWAVAGAKSKLF